MPCLFSGLVIRTLLVLSLASVAFAADQPPAPAARPEGAPEPGQAIRLVGDASVKPKLADGQYQLAEVGVGHCRLAWAATNQPGLISVGQRTLDVLM